MPDTPAWINAALKATEDAIRQVPLTISGSTRETRNGLRNADEVVWEALRAFMEHIPLEPDNLQPAARHSRENKTLRLLKSTFAEQSDAQ